MIKSLIRAVSKHNGVERMGLYFHGKPIQERFMLYKYLDLPYAMQIPGVTYSCELLDPDNRLWIWTNLSTGKTVITGDEGNGWCVPLIIANSREEAIQMYLENPPKAKFRNLLEALKHLFLRSRKRAEQSPGQEDEG